MADAYARKLLKVVVAQLSQAIGWHSIQTTPLELMTDITTKYMEELGKLMHRYTEQFGHSEPNLDDVGLSFRDMGISVHELEEYIRNVDCVACSFEVPKFPISKDSHLNFLKPGSREVVTRPVHVHEHLPPMHPEMEEDDYSNKQAPLSVDIAPTPGSSSPLSSPKAAVFKRPGDPVSGESPALKRARLVLEEEGRPLREISSVMMTTSGFLSPAREGKLPESRTPLQPSDSRSNSPQPSSYPMVPPEVKGEKKYKKGPLKKAADGAKRLDKENKKKEHKSKGLAVDRSTAERALTDEARVKKLVSMKELSKLKALKPGALKLMGASSSGKVKAGKGSPKGPGTAGAKAAAKAAAMAQVKAAAVAQVKAAAAAAAALLRPPIQPPERSKESDVVEGKLLAEPDRQKLNIFKKISKVKEDKTEKVERGDSFEVPQRDSRESSPGLVIDESEVNNRQRDTRMAQIDDCIDAVIQRSMEVDLLSKPRATSGPVLSESPKTQLNPHDAYPAESQVDPNNDVYMFDDDLFPPGTPSTPKTPELPISVTKTEKNSESKEPKEKKKKKDKSKSKKELKKTKGSTSPKKLKMDSIDTRKAKTEVADEESPDWPKTPEGPEPSECASAPVFPFFPHYQPAPGLIPPPIAHPLFQRFPLPIGKNVPHPAMPNLPLPPPLFMQPRTEDPPGERAEAVRGAEAHDWEGDRSPEKREGAPPAAAVARPRDKEEKAVLTPLPPLPLLEKKPSEKKLKEHKKEKKDKEKAKKKKERKEKLKNKEKEEKRKIKAEKKEKDKEKNKEKKEKKDKKKDKERDEKTEGGVPKITFKLGPASPRPPTPDATLRKIVIKPVLKKAPPGSDDEGTSPVATSSSGAAASAEHPVVPAPSRREPSPELARISALVTRPPRQKASSKTSFLKQESSADSFPTSSQPSVPCASVVSTTSSSLPPPATPSPVSVPDSPPSAAATAPGAAPGPAASTTATAVGAASASAAAAATAAAASAKPKKALKPHSKVKAKEGAKKGGSDVEASREPIAFYFDDDGKQVWICPGCGGQDDGSPMIGCDDCDAWYHWVCVGIQVPPDENEDWYCRVCIVKKQENIIDKKKKSRKRKIMT